MANTVTDFAAAHDKSQLLTNKQLAIDELVLWDGYLDDSTGVISVKIVKEANPDNFISLFLNEPPFDLQVSLKTPVKAAIAARIAAINVEIEALKDEVEDLVTP